MSDEQQNQPVFSLQKLYTKDVSFENPNAPQVFMDNESQPKITLNLGVENRQIDDEHWEVSLKVSVLARADKEDSVIFEIEVEHAGIFLMQHIPEEHVPVLLGVDCPAIVFPYTRQLVSQLTVDGGFMPMLLEPFNFAAAYQESQSNPPTTH